MSPGRATRWRPVIKRSLRDQDAERLVVAWRLVHGMLSECKLSCGHAIYGFGNPHRAGPVVCPMCRDGQARPV
jgi:hypothetical protein